MQRGLGLDPKNKMRDMLRATTIATTTTTTCKNVIRKARANWPLAPAAAATI